jgi:outer membrane biosynthesis protein TonB
MIRVPFGTAAAAILVGAIVVGGAVGIMTSPQDEAPAVEASTQPTPAAVPATPAEPAADPQTPAPGTEQTIVETLPPPSQPASTPQVTTTETETTTIVAAPVIVTSWGMVSGCVGCIEHKHPPHPLAAATNRQNQQHAAAARNVVPQQTHYVHPEHIAAETAHSR